MLRYAETWQSVCSTKIQNMTKITRNVEHNHTRTLLQTVILYERINHKSHCMKTLSKILFLTGLVFFTACNHKAKIDELLKDDNTRHDIMLAISNDHNMGTEMVSYLTNSTASLDMMKGSCDFMRTAMASDIMKKDTGIQNLIISNMMFLASRDSIMCDKTCTQMSQNPKIQRMLEKKMKVSSN